MAGKKRGAKKPPPQLVGDLDRGDFFIVDGSRFRVAFHFGSTYYCYKIVDGKEVRPEPYRHFKFDGALAFDECEAFQHSGKKAPARSEDHNDPLLRELSDSLIRQGRSEGDPF